VSYSYRQNVAMVVLEHVKILKLAERSSTPPSFHVFFSAAY